MSEYTAHTQRDGGISRKGFKDFGGVWTVATVKASSSLGSSGGNGGYGRYHGRY